MVTTAIPIAPSLVGCLHCSTSIDAGSKFCGNCGAAAVLQTRHGQMNHSSTTRAVQASNALNAKASQFSKENKGNQGLSSAPKATPSFARNQRQNRVIPQEMRDEMSVLMATLIRERFFLILHYLVFVITNLIGLVIAFKCYVEFDGDELSKMMMASTPLMFINLVALCSLVPIKGTKREIARVKERMTYLKLAMEFDHII